MAAGLTVACKAPEKLPNVGGTSLGNTTLSGPGSESGDELDDEGADTGVDGFLDEPCTNPPNIEFVVRSAGLDIVTLGLTDPWGCEGTNPEPDCDGEGFAIGGAVADYDGDGFSDVALAGRDSPGALMRNQGDGTFVDVSELASVDLSEASGLAWVDVNKDGLMDLFVATWLGERNRLFINLGTGQFREEAADRNVERLESGPIGGTSVAVGDYDLDGWPDIYTTGWSASELEPPINPNRLFHNLGAGAPGVFEDTSALGVELAGYGSLPAVDAPLWYGFSSVFTDLDEDDYPDLIAVADFEFSSVFRNEAGGGFAEQSSASDALNEVRSGMGLAVGDYDLDGDFDAYVTAISSTLYAECLSTDESSLGSGFFENNGSFFFASRTVATKTACGGWGWGTEMADFDNDGLLDIVATNGHPGSGGGYGQYNFGPDRYWQGTGSFDVGAPQCASEVGLSETGQGRGMMAIDFDNDGDLDILETQSGSTAFIYENVGGNDANYLRVSAVGTIGLTSGRGAKIAARTSAGGDWLVREIGVGSSFMGHGELVAHFGLGTNPEVQELRICWPVSRTMQVLNDIPANQFLQLNEASATEAVDGPCAEALLAG